MSKWKTRELLRNWCGAKSRGWSRRGQPQIHRSVPRRIIFSRPWCRVGSARGSLHWICLRENFVPPSFKEKMRRGAYRKNSNNYGPRRSCTRPLLLYLSRGRRLVRADRCLCGSLALLRLRWMIGSLRQTMRFPCWKTILGCCRWRDLASPASPRPHRRREPFSTTYDPRNAALSITWIASVSTSGKTAWCSMP